MLTELYELAKELKEQGANFKVALRELTELLQSELTFLDANLRDVYKYDATERTLQYVDKMYVQHHNMSYDDVVECVFKHMADNSECHFNDDADEDAVKSAIMEKLRPYHLKYLEALQIVDAGGPPVKRYPRAKMRFLLDYEGHTLGNFAVIGESDDELIVTNDLQSMLTSPVQVFAWIENMYSNSEQAYMKIVLRERHNVDASLFEEPLF